MVSVDIYLNETTRHADVILPPVSPLERANYDIAFHQFAVRNNTKFSPQVLEPPADGRSSSGRSSPSSPGALGGANADAVDELMLAHTLAATRGRRRDRVPGRHAPRRRAPRSATSADPSASST